MLAIHNRDGAAISQPFGYIMGYFTESPEGMANAFSLHLAASRDGRNWTALNGGRPVLVPEIGECGMRDPFIFRKQDGRYVVVATNMWNSESIMCYDSPDLIRFENGRLLRLNNSGMHAWAPEIIYDPERLQYAIFWSGNTDRNRIYVNYTDDFLKVTDPEIFFDPGYDVIDASITKHEQTYVLAFKDERNPEEAPQEGKRIKGAAAASLSPGSFNKVVFSRPFGLPMIEGPVIIHALEKEKWYLYGDCYQPINAKYFAWETSDLRNWDWRPMDRRDYQLPPNAKHISIVDIGEIEWERMMHVYKTQGWQRLRSYALPDYYVKVEESYAKLAAIPFDPYTSSLWKVVAGLIGEGISFESIHQPDCYLTCTQCVLRVSQWEDSDAFRKSSTFLISQGLSEPSWSSFSPYLNPELYMIVDGAYLRVSSVEYEEEKSFATFQLA
ncbi:AbfB domain-containing protein [Paenibacillus sp. CAU 1782]